MTLVLHRAERTDLLADGLAELLSDPLDDPFATELVVVPARGVERWLSQRLSHRLGTGTRGRDGVCAGVGFASPHSLVSMLLDRGRDDPWEPDQLVWPLLQVVDDALGEPWAATLSHHLGHGVEGLEGELRRNRRYAVARRLAGLFASYARQRPRLVTDWREGRDTDGAGGVLAADLAWQPELWRRLVAAVDHPPPDQRHADAVARLESGGDGLDLPGRLSLFGHTRLPVTEVALLRALARLRDVHLWLPQASPGLWDDVAEAVSPGSVRRREDTSARYVGHPLLGSLGRDGRELQRALLGAVDDDARLAVERPAPTTVLGHLQADLRANRAPTATQRASRVVAPDDRSVQVHACHGPAPPGRGAARGARRAAPGPTRARAARHPRDVPRRRDLRAADRGRVRARRGGPGRPPGPRAAGAARRPGAQLDQPAARPWPPGWSSSPAAGSPRPTCSTWSGSTSYAAGSGSTTTTWSGSPTGSPSPGSAGASTATSGRRST